MGRFKQSFVGERRKFLGMTMVDMANDLGCSVATYCRYEHGQSKIPAELLPRLAWTLRCKVKDFFT